MKNNKITLENLAKGLNNLAREMKRGFIKIDKKFLVVGKRFDEMETKIDKKIDSKIDSLARIVKFGFDEVGERLDRIEKKSEEDDKQHKIINVRLDNLERGQDKIAERLGIVERKRA